MYIFEFFSFIHFFTETLCGYFSQFDEVVDSVVMKNNETGRSRGFGFVTFKDPNCVHKVLQVTNHELDGKKVNSL